MVSEKEGNKDAMLKRQLSIKRALHTIKKARSGVYTCKSSSGEVKTGRFLSIPGQPA